MSGGSDEVKEGVDSVISETGVTLDSRLFGQNVIILSFEVANDLAEGGFVVDLVSEAGGVDNGEGHSGAFFI